MYCYKSVCFLSGFYHFTKKRRDGCYSYYFHNEPQHEIFNNVVCATSKASDQPVHTHSLNRAFDNRLNILKVLSY